MSLLIDFSESSFRSFIHSEVTRYLSYSNVQVLAGSILIMCIKASDAPEVCVQNRQYRSPPPHYNHYNFGINQSFYNGESKHTLHCIRNGFPISESLYPSSFSMHSITEPFCTTTSLRSDITATSKQNHDDLVSLRTSIHSLGQYGPSVR